MPTGRFAQVAVERGVERLGGEPVLTYRVEGDEPGVGERVQVPLGKGGKLVAGMVLAVGGPELAPGLSAEGIKAIARRTGARLGADLIGLARWMAEYYVCPLGMVLAAMMPAAVKHGTGRVEREYVSPVRGADASALQGAAKRAWEAVAAMEPTAFPMPLRELRGVLGHKTAATLKRLQAAGLLATEQREEVRSRAMPTAVVPRAVGFEPTPAQQTGIDGVAATLGTFGVHLLFGVTGSGKTEVYLRLIERVVGRGDTAIVLVPEIALTPQAQQRFTSRFGERHVAVLHSGLTAAQRHSEWRRASCGEARVIVGARSALFAPVQRLGLVVVDEEHDGSYKQDQLPRYHGRDTAIIRARLAGCPVVLGSATPSLESWANATKGRYRLWELALRVVGALPTVRIVDMSLEKKARRVEDLADGRQHLLGPTLEREIAHTLERGGRALLLLNRRGFASHVWCVKPACRFVASCEYCDANLVLHRGEGLPAAGVVRCHHCGAEQRVPRLCPMCGTRLQTFGGGTQRAAAELVSKFAGLGLIEGETLLRMDSDTMKSGRDYYAAFEKFASGEARVLLGTQMIAKGLDFPDVGLVGIIDADTALSIPDFRSAERTFQLVSQVAGRAGRGAMLGKVLVQTLSPDAPAIRLAAANDYRGFAAMELAFRERSGLPPATRMARVVCRDAKLDKARKAAEDVAAALREAGGVRVAGPYPCTIARIAGFHRFGVEVVGERAGLVQAALRSARGRGLLKSDSRTAVDVDPVSLM